MNQDKESLASFALSTIFSAGAIGLVGGIISGLFGVGGGIVLVPAMMHFMGMSIHKAVGSSLVVIIPTAIMGAWKHNQLGNIEWRAVLSLIPMAIIGGWIGAWLTSQISADNLKRAFGAFLVLVGCRLIFLK
jgi:uncharacterized membrane protein YfcA